MPARLLTEHAEHVYPQLVQVAGFRDSLAIKKHLAGRLARAFEVSCAAMDIRLREWPMRIYDRVERAMKDRLDYLP